MASKLVLPHALFVVIRRVTEGLCGLAVSVFCSLEVLVAWKEENIV
jgi:hypothetical protein